MTSCYNIPIVIEDIDECSLPASNPYRHKCHNSAVCQNTVGSYECSCPGDYFGVEGSGSFVQPTFLIRASNGLCGGKKSTGECCYAQDLCDNDSCRLQCKKNFRCTNDPCHAHKCHEKARCIPGLNRDLRNLFQSYVENGPNYSCECLEGYKGDGYDCKEIVKPVTNYCEKHNCPKNCKCESVPSKKGYKCTAKDGYVTVEGKFAGYPVDHVSRGGRRLDNNLCMDTSVPELKLNGPKEVYLQQGDSYEEFGVEIVDQNSENYSRLLKIEYSEPLGTITQNPHLHLFGILRSNGGQGWNFYGHLQS